MSEEKKEEPEKQGDGERRVTIQIEGCEACCGTEAAGVKLDGKQRVIKVICCPSKKEKGK